MVDPSVVLVDSWISRACLYGAFVSVNTNDIFTNDEFSILDVGRKIISKDNENGVNILKSIDEGPFQMGTFRETLAEGEEGTLHLGPKRTRVYSDLSPEDKERFTKLINDMRNIKMTMPRMQLNSKFFNNMLPEWGRFITAVKLNRALKESNYDQLTSSNTSNQATVQDGNVVVQNVQGRRNRGQGNNARGTCVAGNRGAHNRVGNVNPGQARQITCYNCNGEWVVLDKEQFMFIVGGQENTVDEDVDVLPVQDLALNVDNVFQANDCDAFDSDVDEAPTAQTMFMANLLSIDHVYDEVDPSYDSDILSKVYDHDKYQDAIYEHHEVHEMHDDVQPKCIVVLDAEYTGDSNMIPYDQYVKDNAEPIVQNNVSSIPNDASDVFESASDSNVNESEKDNNQANDRYKASEGYHAVPPPYTGNFMPLRPDLSFAGLDDSIFKSAISETVTSLHETETSASKTSKESMEKPTTVRPSAPIIKD
nr:hypothetical protein [Tanacetum cinerariifolium]